VRHQTSKWRTGGPPGGDDADYLASSSSCGIWRGYRKKLKAAVAGIAHEARRVAIAARELDLEHDLRPDLCYRLEQWDSDSLARTVSATSSLYVAIAGWQEAVKLDPASTWLLRQGAHVLKEHKPS
jgi:hypothetical protein